MYTSDRGFRGSPLLIFHSALWWCDAMVAQTSLVSKGYVFALYTGKSQYLTLALWVGSPSARVEMFVKAKMVNTRVMNT